MKNIWNRSKQTCGLTHTNTSWLLTHVLLLHSKSLNWKYAGIVPTKESVHDFSIINWANYYLSSICHEFVFEMLQQNHCNVENQATGGNTFFTEQLHYNWMLKGRMSDPALCGVNVLSQRFSLSKCGQMRDALDMHKRIFIWLIFRARYCANYTATVCDSCATVSPNAHWGA